MEPTDKTTNDDGAIPVAPAALEYPVCTTCGSENVVCDAWARWDQAKQEWELDQTFDDTFCHDCEESRKVEWKRITETQTDRTRRLNDEMRAGILTAAAQAYGSVVMTRGIADRGQEFVVRAAQAVASFDAFDASNDPYAEHDFGAFDLDGERLFFKTDLYEYDPVKGPDSPRRETRVLTIMLAEEY